MTNSKLRFAIAFLLVGVIAGVGFLVFYLSGDTKKTYTDVKLNLSSELASDDPAKTAANFIKSNGTMGDISKVNQEYFNKTNDETNSKRRGDAYKRTKTVIFPGSPLLDSRVEKTIENDNVEFPTFYEITDVKAGNVTTGNSKSLAVTGAGTKEYESATVLVDFTTSKYTLTWPTDLESESIIKENKTTEDFGNIQVTLVKSEGLWYVYDVTDIEDLLNVRMSTWKGIGVDDVSTDEEVINEFEMNYDVE